MQTDACDKKIGWVFLQGNQTDRTDQLDQSPILKWHQGRLWYYTPLMSCSSMGIIAAQILLVLFMAHCLDLSPRTEMGYKHDGLVG